MSVDNVNDIILKSKQMLENLYKDQNEEIAPITTAEQLRTEIANFVAQQTRSISKQDAIRHIAELELAQRIFEHQLSNSELLTLLKIQAEAKAINTTPLLDIFKPTNNTPNSLLTPPVNKEDELGILADLKPEEKQALNKLYLILQKENGKKKEDV